MGIFFGLVYLAITEASKKWTMPILSISEKICEHLNYPKASVDVKSLCAILVKHFEWHCYRHQAPLRKESLTPSL